MSKFPGDKLPDSFQIITVMNITGQVLIVLDSVLYSMDQILTETLITILTSLSQWFLTLKQH